MRILHSSDQHGRLDQLVAELHRPDYEVWVDTGDLLPTRSPWLPELEQAYQERYLTTTGASLGSLGHTLAEHITKALAGRPAVLVSGNHDFINAARVLCQAGANAHNVSTHGPITIDDVVFAGFREIPYIEGVWPGEAQDDHLERLVDEIVELSPHVLLTHAPPRGVLDSIQGSSGARIKLGIDALDHGLCYAMPRLRLHCFGHIHEHGGRALVRDGITFSNAATRPTGAIYEIRPGG